MKTLITMLLFLSLNVVAYAETSTKEQKVDFAQRKLNEILDAAGYRLINESVTVYRSARLDFLVLNETVGALVVGPSELRVVSFQVKKGNDLLSGWTYLFSGRLDPATSVNDFGMINDTAEIIGERWSESSNAVELFLMEDVWSEVAPTIDELHLTE